MKTRIVLFSFIFAGVSFAQQDTLEGNRRALYECSDPIDVDSNTMVLKENKIYFQFNTEQRPTDLKAKDFYWLPDNPEGYFTAYLINTTDTTFSANRQDGSLIMIQEALDENGKWNPIEYWVYSGCWNSYFSPLKLNAGKCVLIPIKKYTGTFKTKIRLKFKYGDHIMYSHSFDGSINQTQFRQKDAPVFGILYHGPASYLDND